MSTLHDNDGRGYDNMKESTMPYTIAAAIEFFRQPKKVKNHIIHPTNATTTTTADSCSEEIRSKRTTTPQQQHHDHHPIDLIGVVLHVDILNLNNAAKTPTARLTIRDASLTRCEDHCQILLFGRRRVHDIADKVQRGDVLRFNRVHLLPPSNRNLYHEKESTNTYVFRHSFHDLEAGLDYFRLLRLEDATTSTTISLEGTYQRDVQHFLRHFECVRVPDSMQTDATYLKNLIAWYLNSEYCAVNPPLPSLPCQYRSLAELQSCQGVISHVVAKVMYVESTNLMSSPHKRQRKATITMSKHSTYTGTTFARLVDALGTTMMTFVLDHSRPEQKHFRNVVWSLSSSQNRTMDQFTCIHLSRVVTKRRHHTTISGTTTEDSLVLVPTLQTTVRSATQEEIQNHFIIPMDMSPMTHLSWTQSQHYSTTNTLTTVMTMQRNVKIRSPLCDVTIIKSGISLANNATSFVQEISQMKSSINGTTDAVGVTATLCSNCEKCSTRIVLGMDDAIVRILVCDDWTFQRLRQLLESGLELCWDVLFYEKDEKEQNNNTDVTNISSGIVRSVTLPAI